MPGATRRRRGGVSFPHFKVAVEAPPPPQGDMSAGFDGTSILEVDNDGTFTPANNEDWSVVFWVYFDTVQAGVLADLVSCVAGAVAGDTWFTHYNGDTDLFVGGISTGSGYVTVGVSQAVSLETWYMFSFGVDNDGSPVVVAELWNEAGKIASALNSGTGFSNTSQNNALRIGDFAGSTPLIGRLDKIGIYNRLLVDADHTALHNSGLGLSYNELPEAQKTGLVAWYDLDEREGETTWVDSHGSNDLTATGTVTSEPPSGS